MNFTRPNDRGVDSYNRMGHLVENFVKFPERRKDCFLALGEGWSGCDDIVGSSAMLVQIFSDASRGELDLLMTSEERDALAALPMSVTIYRGCFHDNKRGLSWSLDRDIAAGFTLFNRYCRPEAKRLLVTARIPRARIIALKLDRCESEVIAVRPKVISVEVVGA